MTVPSNCVDISLQLPFVLDAVETYEINREIVAAAYEKVFEHPEDGITALSVADRSLHRDSG